MPEEMFNLEIKVGKFPVVQSLTWFISELISVKRRKEECANSVWNYLEVPDYTELD